jgi:predicted KAP-like P-loop ATPase
MKPVIDDELKDNAQNLTIDHILKGPEGYAQYALEYPLKDRVCCVDYSRRKVKFKDPNGNVITDPEMSTLATKFFQSIKDKNNDLIIEYGTKLNEHLGDRLGDLIEILDIKSGVDNGADGSKTEFYHDFVKNICGKTIME